MEDLDPPPDLRRLTIVILLVSAGLFGIAALVLFSQAMSAKAEAEALRLEAKQARVEAQQVSEDARLRELAHARELRELRKRLAETEEPGDVPEGDLLFAYDFTEGITGFRSQRVSSSQYLATEGDQLVVG